MAEDINDYFKTFEEYSGVVKEALKSILHDSKMGTEDKIDVIYATGPLAFSKYLHKVTNGQNPGPTASFYLSGIDIDPSQQLLGFTKVTLENKYIMRAPIVAKLDYTVTLFCISESQGDLFTAQIMMGMPFNRPYATMLNGQWVTITASDPENLSSVEAGAETEKISKRQLKVTIDRAYLEYDMINIEHFVKGFCVHMYELDGVNKNDYDANDPFSNRNVEIKL